MSKSAILKVATLFSSISLVLAFFLFRTGIFEKSDFNVHRVHTSPNSGAVISVERDTVPVDTAALRILSSSKSIILVEPKTPSKSFKYKNINLDSVKKKDSYLWTTKSGRIFKTVSLKKDSLQSKGDTVKTKGKQ